MKKFIIFCMALVLAGCNPTAQKTLENSTNRLTIEGSGGSYVVDVELAQTKDEQARGLMFRQNLNADAGMFFIFPDEAPRSFWMKNTRIPLDMIFADKNLTIQTIVEDAVPCESDPCVHYRSVLPAMYVLEVPAGFAKEHNLQAGDHIIYPS